MRAFGCCSRSRLGAGIGAGAASGGRKSCPRALLPRGPQFRLLGGRQAFFFFFNGVSFVRIFAIAAKNLLPNELDVALRDCHKPALRMNLTR